MNPFLLFSYAIIMRYFKFSFVINVSAIGSYLKQ